MAEKETLDDLGDELKRITNTNAKLLSTIESNKSKQVVCDHSYSLDFGPSALQSSTNKEQDGDEVWSLTSKKQVKDVSKLLEEWRYSGEPLIAPEDIFNEGIDYNNLNTYADVIHLNDQIVKMGSKVSECLVDCPRTIDILHVMIKNATSLHAAIMELYGLTCDVKNPVGVSTWIDMMKKGPTERIEKLKNEGPEENGSDSSEAVPLSRVNDIIENHLTRLKQESKAKEKRLMDMIKRLNKDVNDLKLANETNITKHKIEKAELEMKFEEMSRKIETAEASLKEKDEEVAKLKFAFQHETKTRSSDAEKYQEEQQRLRNDVDRLKKECGIKDTSLLTRTKDCYNMFMSQARPAVKDPRNFSCHAILKKHTSHIFSLVAFEINGSTYLASGSGDNTIKLWDVQEQRLVGTLQGHSRGVSWLAVVQYQGYALLASCSFDCTIKLWDVEEQVLVGTLCGHSESVTSLAAFKNREGSMCLASGGFDNVIKLWNVENQKLLGVLRGHSDNVNALAVFEHQGSTCLASGSFDNTIKLWNIEDKNVVGTLRGHTDCVFSLAVYECGGSVCLASGSYDRTIKLWNVEKQTLLGTLQGHCHAIMSLAVFENKGSICLATGSDNRTINLWNIEEQKLLHTMHMGLFADVFVMFKCQGTACLAVGGESNTIKLWKEL